MQITVQLDAAATRCLQHQGPPTPDIQELVRITEQFGVVLQPIHPETEDPNLSRHFTVEAPDRTAAERMIAGLRKIRAVEAAYLKPTDAMP